MIRGSFGLFYDLVAGKTQRAQNMSINNASSVTATADAPFGDVNPLVPTAAPSNQAPYSDPTMKSIYSEQWNFEIQRELMANLAMSIAYVGSHNVRVAVGGDYNTAIVPGPGPIAPRQRWPYAPVTNWDRAAGQSHYHGLHVKLERRLARGLSFLTAYTWSKSIDTASSGYGSTEKMSLQNPYDPNSSRSVSGFDIPHLFSTAVIYVLPFGHGKPWLNTGIASRMFGNWQFNLIATLRSGEPFTPQMNVDIANIGAVNNAIRTSPDLLRDPHVANPAPVAWFDKTAFAAPRQFSFGSAGRNILRADSVQNFDLSLFREDSITERFKLQFRGEAFNVFNHPAFGIPQTVFTSPQFGQVSGTTSTARQIQLGLKLLF